MKKQRRAEDERPFDRYIGTLSAREAEAVAAFFRKIRAHVKLPPRERARLREDFERALLYYFQAGVPLDEALGRLSVKHLGGFYARPPIVWYALDDAAKIYPLSMKRGQMSVFRLSVYLKKPVVPELLQVALTYSIKRFPSFATTVKKGFFWHYLDAAKRRFLVEPDSGLPCRPLKIEYSGSQSFRVMYYDNRISAEFFHVLTDGTGGMIFLKTLTAEYLRLLGAAAPPGEGALDTDALPEPEETENAFCRAGQGAPDMDALPQARKGDAPADAGQRSSGAGFVDRPAVQMSGRLAAERPYRVLHFQMDAAALRAAAKRQGATVTAYLLAQMFLAGRYATDEPGGDMSIQVPVNMRKFYPSATVRNFSMYCGVRLPLTAVRSAGEILPDIAAQLANKASKEAMGRMMFETQRLVGAMRYIPLFIKAPAARLVYGFLGDRIFSNTLSNLGVVRFPTALCEHIQGVDFVLGTALTNRAGCALATFGDTATLSITKMTADPSFEERLYDLLSGDGIQTAVEGSVPLADPHHLS